MSRVLVVVAVLAAGCTRAAEPPAEQVPGQSASPPVAEATSSPRSCLRLELAPLTLVRADEAQRRLFVTAPAGGDGPVAARIRDLDACFEFTDWAGRWSLSVFSDAALARYKDDPQVEAAVKDGRWAKAYLAEYDAATKTLSRLPAGSQ